MKLVSFGPAGRERPGLIIDETHLIDLSKALREQPLTMIELLAGGLLDAAADAAKSAAAAAKSAAGAAKPGDAFLVERSTVRLGAPVPHPSKILCLGLNYRDHAEEQNKPIPTRPMVFSKPSTAVIADGEAIRLPDPAFETFTDAEAELAVVIGRRASKISEADALDHVAGYTILNDVSGRDTQKAEKQWVRAKGFDTFAPMGPWIVTGDEIPDPHNLDVVGSVNSEVRQKSNTRHLIFDVPYLVSYLSQTITLLPGDLISTGTPGGVGIYRDPPVRLEAGDRVRIEISSIGALENPVIDS